MLKTALHCAAASDPGLVRQNNEDGFWSDPDRGIFLVVDGIGGQNAGEKAAEIAIARIRARLERQTGTPEQRVREAIAMANNEILRAAGERPEWAGMACVLTLVLLDNGSAVVGHVGDSRLYKIRHGKIVKITHDHSPVGEREDRGELSETEAMRHPRRNEVFRDVGSEPHEPEDPDFIELERIPFEPDCALVLCSDGLSDQVLSKDIRATVERHATDLEAAARELIDAANLAGGKDNVTALLVAGEEFAAPAPAEVGAKRRVWPALVLMFVCGSLAAAGAAWFARPWWRPDPVVIAPHVLHVGPEADYLTIQAALAQARSGDTIEVAPGEYRGPILLKDGVALESREPRQAILRPPGDGSGPVVLGQEVEGARLAGFHVIGKATGAPAETPVEGIVLINSFVELVDMEIEGASTGIDIRGTVASAGAPVLIGNGIHDCTAEGILISGSSTPRLSHNALLRNGKAGVAARDGAHPLLLANVFEKNAADLPAGTDMAALRQSNFFIDIKPPGGRKK
ncbi:MAG TPA: protein phosphatase 2C domain-containing protein [Bryobacteraceae bacterium]|nr:protein phosphatase 2C domain-containing protein [Bryobacteraceae bacterium]